MQQTSADSSVFDVFIDEDEIRQEDVEMTTDIDVLHFPLYTFFVFVHLPIELALNILICLTRTIFIVQYIKGKRFLN